MALFRLCYITDRKGLPAQTGLESGALTTRIREGICSGIDLVQIREKDLTTRELVALVQSALEAARGTPTRVVVNDRLDVALALGASGVHLGRQSLEPRLVRRLVPQNFLIGVSCHSLEEARDAEAAGASYIIFGPVFETPSKLAFGPPLGIEALREAATNLKLPVLAVGGVTLESARGCFQAGASGIAAIRLFQDCPSVSERVKKVSESFRSGS